MPLRLAVLPPEALLRGQIQRAEKYPFAGDENLLFVRASETPKNGPSGGSIKAIIPGSIRVVSDNKTSLLSKERPGVPL